MTKTDHIRRLLAKGYESAEIARIVKTTVQYVGATRWRDKNPGYNANHMAAKRRNDLAYYDRERRLEKAKYHADPDYRARKIAQVAAWIKKKRRTDPLWRERQDAYVRRHRKQKRMAALIQARQSSGAATQAHL